MLPLRLGSAATIILDAIKLQKGTLADIITEGTEQSATQPNREFLYARLTESECQVLEQHPVQLFYNPKYDLALSHYARSHYQSSSSESAMLLLLCLETLFDPDGGGTGRSERVAARAASFAATSIEQRRDMRKEIVQGYTHRGTLRHGETNQEKIREAKTWFSGNLVSLQTIAAWAIQRVMILASEHSGFDVVSYTRDIEQGNQSALKEVMSLPLFWVKDLHSVLPLPFDMFAPRGGIDSIEIIKRD